MSLQSRPIPPIPDLTAKVARRAFRKGNIYMQMRDVLGAFFIDDPFAAPIITPCICRISIISVS